MRLKCGTLPFVGSDCDGLRITVVHFWLSLDPADLVHARLAGYFQIETSTKAFTDLHKQSIRRGMPVRKRIVANELPPHLSIVQRHSEYAAFVEGVRSHASCHLSRRWRRLGYSSLAEAGPGRCSRHRACPSATVTNKGSQAKATTHGFGGRVKSIQPALPVLIHSAAEGIAQHDVPNCFAIRGWRSRRRMCNQLQLRFGCGRQTKLGPQWLGRTVVTIEPLAIVGNYGATCRTGFHLVACICDCRNGAEAYNKKHGVGGPGPPALV